LLSPVVILALAPHLSFIRPFFVSFIVRGVNVLAFSKEHDSATQSEGVLLYIKPVELLSLAPSSQTRWYAAVCVGAGPKTSLTFDEVPVASPNKTMNNTIALQT